MGGLRVKVQHFPLTLLVVLTTLTLPCERECEHVMLCEITSSRCEGQIYLAELW